MMDKYRYVVYQTLSDRLKRGCRPVTHFFVSINYACTHRLVEDLVSSTKRFLQASQKPVSGITISNEHPKPSGAHKRSNKAL